ncbi:MAG: hypothetical protein M0R80_25720 [Proteobacteria bacterium]|jgi:hypothetical protein|nr:hypothetical protein [Pseudomonadota bacterium]
MSIIIAIIVLFVIVSLACFGNCSDKADAENFEKDWQRWKKDKTPFPEPRPRSQFAIKFDAFIDWMIGEPYNEAPPPPFKLPTRERDREEWKL